MTTVTAWDGPDRAPGPVDGRSAIRDRNRLAVLDAVLDLFSEDNLSPGPEEVALRAGLSARSVYRYFEDRDALSRAAIERHLEKIVPLVHIPAIGEGDLAGRIERFVTARLRLHEAGAATARATRMRATFDRIVRAQLDRSRSALRHQVEVHFAPELADVRRGTPRGAVRPPSTPSSNSSPSTTTGSGGTSPE